MFGPFHNYPYTDLHETNLDWVIWQVLRLMRKVDGGGDDPGPGPVPDFDYQGGQYGEHTRYYIACNTGSDDNDGLTAATAWKTLDKLLDKVNHGLVDARCYFIEPGDYYVTHQFIANAVLHLAPTVNGVNIRFNYTDPEAFYFQNCHVKFGRDTEPYQLNIYTTGYGITAEGGEMSMYYTNLHDKFYQFGGYFNGAHSGADWFRFSGTSGMLSDMTIFNTSPSVWALYLLRGANIYLTDSLTFANLSAGGSDSRSAAIYASSGSTVWINSHTDTEISNKYYYLLYLLGANAYSFQGRITAMTEKVCGRSQPIAANRMSNVFFNTTTPGVYGDSGLDDLIEVVTS